MCLVEVDHVHLQTTQGVLGSLGDPGGAGVVGDADDDAALGRDHHPVPQLGGLGEDLTEEGLGVAKLTIIAVAIDVGVIEQGDAQLEGRLPLGASRRDVGPSEAPAAVRQGRGAKRGATATFPFV